MNTSGVGKTNVARRRVSRKGDLTTLGTLKRSLTSRIKLRHCNCRRRRHCDSTFPSLLSSDSSFRYLPSLTHSSQPSPPPPKPLRVRFRYRSHSPFADKGIQFSLANFIARAVTVTMIKLFLMWEHTYPRADDVTAGFTTCEILRMIYP